MSIILVMAAIVASFLMIYLLVALLKPEMFA